MKLRDFLKQFEGLDPETEVYKREGFEDDPPMKDFGKAFTTFESTRYESQAIAIGDIKSIIV